MTSAQAAREIGRLANRILKLAPLAGLYVGIRIEPAKVRADRVTARPRRLRMPAPQPSQTRENPMTVSVSLDRDVEVRVKKYAEGIGVSLEVLCERAIIYALTSLYPDNELPEGGEGGEIDNSLPPFDGRVDNELPEGEIPVDPEYGVEEGGGRPSTGNPNLNPNPDVNANPDLQRGQGRPDQSLPGTPEPKV